MVSKTLLESKTFWFNFATAVVAAVTLLVPGAKGVGDFLQAHVAEIGLVWGMIGMFLRLVTSGKITLVD